MRHSDAKRAVCFIVPSGHVGWNLDGGVGAAGFFVQVSGGRSSGQPIAVLYLRCLKKAPQVQPIRSTVSIPSKHHEHHDRHGDLRRNYVNFMFCLEPAEDVDVKYIQPTIVEENDRPDLY